MGAKIVWERKDKMSKPSDLSQIVSDVVLKPFINFLISSGGEYKCFGDLVVAWNAALDALSACSYEYEDFGVYLDAAESKLQELHSELCERERIEIEQLFAKK